MIYNDSPTNLMRILQVNAQRSAAVLAQCTRLFAENRVDLLLLQEPYTVAGELPGFADCASFLTAEPVPMAAIVCRRGCSAPVLVSTLTDEYGVCVSLQCGGQTVYLVSVYFRYSAPLDPYLSYIMRILSRLSGKQVLVAADVNGRSPVWFDTTRDDRGAMVEEFLASNNLYLLNRPSAHTTFSTVNGESNIDITLCTGGLLRRVSGWTVDPDLVHSDHRPIIYALDMLSQRPASVVTRYDYSSFDIQRLKDRFADGLARSSSSGNRFSGAEMQRLVVEVVSAVVGKRASPKFKTRWWDRELAEQRVVVRRARRCMQRLRRAAGSDLFVHAAARYRLELNKYNALISAKKTDSWRRFVTDSGNVDPWKTVYRVLRPRAQCRVSTVVRDDGSETTNWTETAEYLLAELFPEVAPHLTEAQRTVVVANDRYLGASDRSLFRLEDLQRVTAEMRSAAAPGVDGVSASIIKELVATDPEACLCALNNTYVSGEFPSCWKTGQLVLVEKSGGVQRRPAAAYRPIVLLPALGKVYEKLIAGELTSFCAGAGLQSPWQFGFRQGRSTVDAIAALMTGVHDMDARYVLAVFVDVAGAFDNLWWPSVLRRLRVSGAPWQLYSVISDFLADRCVVLTEGAQSLSRTTVRGCPQGSVLGPLLWNLVFDEVVDDLEPGCRNIAYADDLVVLVGAGSRKELEVVASRAVGRIYAWAKENLLTISAAKTTMMLLKGRLSDTRHPSVSIGGSPVRYCAETKYLGVVLDERCSFLPHLRYARGRAAGVASQLRLVTRCEWGLSKRTINLLYDSVLVPIAVYGAPIWASRLGNSAFMRLLKSLHRCMLLHISMCCRTVSTEAMQVICDTVPLDLIVAMEACLYWGRRGSRVAYLGLVGRAIQPDESARAYLRNERTRLMGMVRELWQARWAASESGRVTFSWIPSVRTGGLPDWFRPGVFLSFLLTGHGSLNQSLLRFGIGNTDRCFCGEIESADHVLLVCPCYDAPRRQMCAELGLRSVELIRRRDIVSDPLLYRALSVFAGVVFGARGLRAALVAP